MMDCETFDRDVVDLLYEDGDAASREALTLHAATCARCGATLTALRATRANLGAAMASPPEGLMTRILEAEAIARRPPPLSRRVARGASWAGSLAMRPQFAMAAIFCIAIGSSLLLLRARSDAVPGPMSVRDVGVPAPEAAPAAPAPEAAAEEEGRASKSKARADEAPGRALEAPATAEAAEPAPAAPPPPAPGDTPVSSDAGRIALDRARLVLERRGCEVAAPDLRAVAGDYPDTLEAKEASKALETCGRVGSAAKPATGDASGSPANPRSKSSSAAPPGGAP